MDMIEKCARALATAIEDSPVYVQREDGDVNLEAMPSLVRAVLLALREPTEEMLEAGMRHLPPMLSVPIPRDVEPVWQAIIDSLTHQPSQDGDRG